MNDFTLIVSILSSAVIASIISSVFMILTKRMDFRNEYYKEIIKRRLETYELIEKQIMLLKSSTLIEDSKSMVHLIFIYGKDEYEKFQSNLFLAVAKGLYISSETINSLIKLNRILVKISIKAKNNDDLIKAGIENYIIIAELRDELENKFIKDLKSLYKLKNMFKIEHHKNNFSSIEKEFDL
jgi:hypothetical protein